MNVRLCNALGPLSRLWTKIEDEKESVNYLDKDELNENKEQVAEMKEIATDGSIDSPCGQYNFPLPSTNILYHRSSMIR